MVREDGSEDEDRNLESEDTLLLSGDFRPPLFRLSPAAFLRLSLYKDKLLVDKENFFVHVMLSLSVALLL